MNSNQRAISNGFGPAVFYCETGVRQTAAIGGNFIQETTAAIDVNIAQVLSFLSQDVQAISTMTNDGDITQSLAFLTQLINVELFTPTQAIIIQGLPFLSQAVNGAIAVGVILPDAAELSASGKRKHFYFANNGSGPYQIFASNGNQIRIGVNMSAVNGNVLSAAIGDALHLIAVNDDLWLAFSEVPAGSWTVN